MGIKSIGDCYVVTGYYEYWSEQATLGVFLSEELAKEYAENLEEDDWYLVRVDRHALNVDASKEDSLWEGIK